MPASMRKGYLAVAAFVFLSTLAVYSITVTPSIPFWDSGEFIATSHLLGIPHPPGTPLYVLIGRLFAMLPFGNVEWQVNFLSALASAVAVLFTFLVTVRFMRIAQARKGERTVSDEVIAWTCGAVAAFFVAFSNTFWESAIEAEVYSLSSMVQVMAIYLSLRWWEELGNNGGDGRLLLAWYLMCLCIGIHLGTFLVAPAVILLALLVNPRSLFSPRFMLWAAIFLVVGISVHIYLMIRAVHNPSINEGDPETWDKMMYLLQRKQYGSRPMFPRSTTWTFQIQMFMNYFLDQYRLWPLTGAFASVIPMALGLYGAFMQFVREKKTFLMMLCLFGITGFGLIVYLNFTDHEVRERDYFFTSAFHFFAIWIGLGAGFVLELIRDAMKEETREKVSPAFAVACVAAVALSWLPAKTYFFSHDRRGFYIASDYAYNMLEPLKKNAFVFTNGDNDTFPLWCTQAVDHVRTDVRVVNLSLLNTDWYIKQLRDEDPKVPMDVSDEVLAEIGNRGYLLDDQGQPENVNTWMVRNIMRANTGAKERPAYLAVTVPNHMALDKRLKLEGLVFRIYPDSVGVKIDTTEMRKDLYQVFRYRGLFTNDGTYLDKPYKDENAYRLTQNYASGHLQLGFRYRLDGRRAEAVAELERIMRMYPTFPAVRPALGMFYLEIGDTAKGLAFFDQSEKVTPRDPDLAYYHGIALGLTGNVDGAAKRLNDAIDLAPDDGQSYFALYSILFDHGRIAEAADVLKRWLARHPEDPQARRMLEQIAGPGATSSLAPPGGPGGMSGPGGVGLP
jgi:tetratricopeptide (TPR) repeat protein